MHRRANLKVNGQQRVSQQAQQGLACPACLAAGAEEDCLALLRHFPDHVCCHGRANGQHPADGADAIAQAIQGCVHWEALQRPSQVERHEFLLLRMTSEVNLFRPPLPFHNPCQQILCY